jgi:sec-independent protein translocase protein TatB
MLRQLRRMANDAKAEVSRELGPEFQDINLADLNPRTLVRKHLIEPLDLDDLDGVGRTGSANPRRPQAAAGEGSPPPYDEDAT